MSTDSLQDFIEARLRAYDPLIDLTPGSPAQEQIVQPLITRFEPDPLEMNVEDFIVARLQQELPDMNVSEGTGVRDFLVKPDQLLIDPIIREVQLIKQGQSLLNPELLADAEADALVANFFVSRNLGQLATGRVRLYFNAPIAINVTIGNTCYTASGLRYLPTTIQSISAEAMWLNQSGSLYYFDINVTAESAGADYNINAGDIVGITNLTVAVRVTNLNKFSNGLIDEDTTSLIQRAQQSITERSLVVPRGTVARLNDQFSDLSQIQVIGTLDPEMNRDIITGGDLGEVLLSGSDGYAEDDGRGGTTTTRFKTLFGDFTSAFNVGSVSNAYLITNEAAYGVDGQVATQGYFQSLTVSFTDADIGAILVLVSAVNTLNKGVFKIDTVVGTNVVTLIDSAGSAWVGSAETGIVWLLLRGQRQTLISEVLSTNELLLESAIATTPHPLSWTIRRKELTLSNIPGGMLFGDQANTMQSDEVHIGGCTDFYVRGTDVTPQTLVLPAIEDEFPLVKSNTGETKVAYNSFLFDSSVDFVASGVLPGASLTIKSGVNAGTYKILRVGLDPAYGGSYSPHYVQVDVTGPLFSDTLEVLDNTYVIVGSITLDLISPYSMKGIGSYGQSAQASKVFTTTDGVDFVALGASVGDVLRIKEGLDAGDYSITAFSGTGNRNLLLSRTIAHTNANLSWEIFRANAGIQLPLVRVTSVDLLDGSSQPTGDIIPYSEPVDARSTAFSNAGHGIKASTANAQLGIIGNVDLSSLSYPIVPYTTVTIRVNVVTKIINLTGATSAANVVDLINAQWPNIASTIIEVTANTSTYTHLTLRSSDKWIHVVGAQGISVGLVTGDDNRQIKADVDWDTVVSQYGLRAAVDAVNITSGVDVGCFYLVTVASDRLFAVGFDESSGTVRFFSPSLSASLTVGARSTGLARIYFLDPTSFEVHGAYHPALKNTTDNPANNAIGRSIESDESPVTYFTVDLNGASLRYVPDPELAYEIVPTTGAAIPNNLTIRPNGFQYDVGSDDAPPGVLGKNSRNTKVDFIANLVKVGDLIDITYQPVQGTNDLAALLTATPSALVGKDLILKVEGVSKTITFTSDTTTPEKVIEAVNDGVGMEIAFIESILPAAKYIRLEADIRILIVAGSAIGSGLLGLDTVSDNLSLAATLNPYEVIALYGEEANDGLNPYKIQIWSVANQEEPPTVAGREQAHHFTVRRTGVQRLHTTPMAKQTENGLYYMDVELVSDGSGDAWNIPADMRFIATGYTSDGYKLVVADSNLSYSMLEQVKMVLSKSILAEGQSDTPTAAITLTDQNIQVNYENSSTVRGVQSFASGDLDRVLTASILVRHLQPSYVSFDLNYTGGSSEDKVRSDINEYLAALTPTDRVESSSVQDKPKRRGASFVSNPITLLAITHDEERNILVERSTNYVSHSRLSTFFPGTINITKS
ncbi:Baseplate protein J-like [uncultured Caudovirales phage]|uniref:Baseplate protein J-like n=1 Tax=uncultured Caudovirales phage TaxID=2100421 RepID=A0A6J5L9B2_9CAUD|nr:Baseplate protein J-like [uncultured Caudovirales phage]CAB4135156.1 Baseplate protein J-like [uncultured Caudovirales phage]